MITISTLFHENMILHKVMKKIHFLSQKNDENKLTLLQVIGNKKKCKHLWLTITTNFVVPEWLYPTFGN